MTHSACGFVRDEGNHEKDSSSGKKEQKIQTIQGKYNPSNIIASPYSAYVAAFDQLGKQISEKNDFNCKMKDCLQYEGKILLKVIPSFVKFEENGQQQRGESNRAKSSEEEKQQQTTDCLRGDENGGNDGIMLAKERLFLAFRFFLRNFTTKIGPLCLFLDDLQWSDKYSQELTTFLANDDKLYNFILIGSFRSEEEYLMEGLRPSIVSKEDIVTNIELDNLSLESFNDWMENLLRRDTGDDKIHELSKILHFRSGGNPYFSLQLLFQLQSQNVLTYDFMNLRWEWDMSRVLMDSNVSNTVIEVVTDRILQSPTKVQRLLQLASCLGFLVEEDVLRALDEHVKLGLRKEHKAANIEEMKMNDDDSTFCEALKLAQEQNFLESWSTGVVKLSHDRVQQVVYDTIGTDTESLHVSIGLYLYEMYLQKGSNKDESSDLLFMSVRQQGRGSKLLSGDSDTLQLIELSYEAAKVAREQGWIATVYEFLSQAVDLMIESYWVTNYEMMLNVHNDAAEITFGLGMIEKANSILWAIKKHGKSNSDKIRALVIEYQILGLSCRFLDAVSSGGQILRLLGEKVPKQVGLHHVAIEYMRARWEARKKPDAFFTSLKPTVSEVVRRKLHILRIGSIYGWNGNSLFAGFAMLRGFRISIRHGWSEATPFLLSGYGFMLGLFGDISEAYRFGQLALKSSKSIETFPNASILTFASCLHLKEPLNVVLKPYLEAYRISLQTGDLFNGTVCLACYALGYIACGLRLGSYSEDLLNYCHQLRTCNQDLALVFILVPRQLALNLTGNSSNPLLLSQDAIRVDQIEFYAENLFTIPEDAKGTVPAGILYMWYLQLYNAYVLEDETLAKSAMKNIMGLNPDARRMGGAHMMNYFMVFVDGLVGLWLMHDKSASDRKYFKKIAESAIRELKAMSKSGRATNSMTLLKILIAAKSCREESVSASDARKLFNPAITEFSRNGDLHFTAIANELAGNCMLTKGESFWAEHYLREACECWFDYDAKVKARQMLKKYQILKEMKMPTYRRTSDVQGRSQYDVATDSILIRYGAGRSAVDSSRNIRDASEEFASTNFASGGTHSN